MFRRWPRHTRRGVVLEAHPDFERPEAVGLLTAVLTQPRRPEDLIDLVVVAEVVGHQAEGIPHSLAIPDQRQPRFDRDLEPFVVIQGGAVGQGDGLDLLSISCAEDGWGPIGAVDVEPQAIVIAEVA